MWALKIDSIVQAVLRKIYGNQYQDGDHGAHSRHHHSYFVENQDVNEKKYAKNRYSHQLSEQNVKNSK
jgi:hypothetical protein